MVCAMEIVLVAAAVLAGVGAAYLTIQRATGGGVAVRRGWRRVPLTTLAAAEPAGVRRLAGTVRAAGEPPVSEASGRAYVARDLRIGAHDGSGPLSWRGMQSAGDFLLDDGTGVALVRAADGGRVALPRDFEAPRTTLDRVPWADALLRDHGYRNGSPATCRVRIYEGVLAPGDRAEVIGRVEPADAAARALGARFVVSDVRVRPGDA